MISQIVLLSKIVEHISFGYNAAAQSSCAVKTKTRRIKHQNTPPPLNPMYLSRFNIVWTSVEEDPIFILKVLNVHIRTYR